MKFIVHIYLVLVIVLTISLLIGSANPAQAQGDDAPWPFIYYYSNATGSWIIERADGTDGFELGAGLNCGQIYDNSWSPSGHWFMWHCQNRDYNYTNRWIVVSADNSRRITALDLFSDLRDDYMSAQWSPTEDLVAVNTLMSPPASDTLPEWGPGIYIIDANRDEIVREDMLDVPIDNIEWSPDGQFVLAYSTQSFDQDADLITIIPVNGESAFTHEDIRRQRQLNSYAARFIWTPDNRLIDQRYDTGKLVLEDLGTGDQEILPFTTTPLDHVWYSTDNQHGLIYAGSELWLHTVSTDTLIQIADDVVPLPQDPYAYEYKQPSYGLPDWSPDGSRALFATQDGQLHWLHADGQITAPNIPVANESPTTLPRMQWGGDLAFILWNNVVYIYDSETESVLSTFTEPDHTARGDDKPVQNSQVSPSGRYMAYLLGSYYSYYVWDWTNDTKEYLTPNPIIGEGERMVYSVARWHPHQDVLFLSEAVDLAGPGLMRWSVASGDGKLIRALSSADNAGAPQELPDRVDTSFIPPSTEPLVRGPSLQIRIPFNFEVEYLSWSPDGQYLAVGSSESPPRSACSGGRPTLIYDPVSGEKVAEFPFVGCGCGYNPKIPQDNMKFDAYLSIAPEYAGQSEQAEQQYSGYPLGIAWPQTAHNTIIAMPIRNCLRENKLVFWDFTTNEIMAEYSDIRAIAFSPDRSQVALGYEDGRVVLTTYPKMDFEAEFATLPTPISNLIFSADGTRLVVDSANDGYHDIDGELSVWSTASGEPIFQTSPNPVTGSLDITPDGATIILAAQQYRCLDYGNSPPTMIDVASGEALTEPNTSLTAAVISDDGHYLAGTGCGVVIWDAYTLDVVDSFLGNGICAEWNPDGTRLATATRFGIYIWDMP